METYAWIGIIAAMVVSRFINERGYRTLSSDEKLRLMDEFSWDRAFALIPIVLLGVLFWLLATKTAMDRATLQVTFFTLLAIYIVSRIAWNLRRLNQLNMPGEYQRMFTISQVISLLGLGWFVFAMMS